MHNDFHKVLQTFGPGDKTLSKKAKQKDKEHKQRIKARKKAIKAYNKLST
jgi:hypothetical protein